MTLLQGQTVLVADGMEGRALARALESFGARLEPFRAERLDAADFLIDGVGLPVLASRGLDAEGLRERFPKLIHVSVSTYGSFGPRARWLGGELQASAVSGILRLTGEPDRPPVKEALDACIFHADMAALAGAMAAHAARGAGGPGRHVDVSVERVAFSRNLNGVLVWQFDKRHIGRVGGALNYGRATVRCIWKLADGWCFHSLMTGRFGAPANQALSDWMDEAGVPNPLRGVDWLTYNRSTLPADTRATWEAAISAFFATRTKAEIAVDGLRRGINACVANEPVDVLADRQLEARGFWRDEGGLRAPGRFVTVTDGAAGPPRPAIRPSERGGPLSGLRVLDFSWALVGSITTKVLGDLGADVIKVESRSRPCLSRLDVQVSASSDKSFDDKPWFAHLNSSKRSLALDMKKPGAFDVLEPLIKWCDVVVENFSPGTMEKLGLGYQRLAALNPGVVLVSGSVYGQTGPMAQEWGVDGTGGALSGRTFLTGWPDRDPVIPGAAPYGDVIVPYVMAAAAAAAVERRRTQGIGAHVDASMYEICVQQMRSAIVAAQSGQRPARMGNADPEWVLQDVFPARGDDRWIAISAATEDQRATLMSLSGGDLAAWTSAHDAEDLAAQLQARGIAAAPVRDMRDQFERADGQAQSGGLVELPHPLLGPFGHIRTPVDFSVDGGAPYRPPALGEHTRDIVTGVAGLSPEQFAQLEAAGVFR